MEGPWSGEMNAANPTILQVIVKNPLTLMAQRTK